MRTGRFTSALGEAYGRPVVGVEPSAAMLEVAASRGEPHVVWKHGGAEDILIDGGNSYYIDDIRRSAELKAKGLHYVGVGTSGGIWGLERGDCQMIGGEEGVVKHLDPIFATLAREAGYEAMTLWTNDCLVAARHIYEAAGFKLAAEERHRSFGHDLVGQNWNLTL